MTLQYFGEAEVEWDLLTSRFWKAIPEMIRVLAAGRDDFE